MKITEILAHPLSAAYAQPRWTAHERMERDQIVLVEVRTDQGLIGFGEIAGGPQKLICDLVRTFAGVISGMDPLGHTEIWEKLFSLTSPRPGGIGGWDGMPAPLPRNQRPQIMAAIGGIDIALWDLKGKAVNMPVFRLLGGTRTEIFTYSTGGYYREGEPLERCAEEYARFVADGYRAVKLKTGALSLADEVDADPVCARGDRARRDADAGHECALRCRGLYPLRRGSRAVTTSSGWRSRCTGIFQPADYVRLAAASPIPLAHCEREWHRYTVRDFIDSGAIGFVQFDSTRAAGFTESLRIAHYAEQKGVVIAPHSALHVHAHLVSAFGDAAFGGNCTEIPPAIRSITVSIAVARTRRTEWCI